MIERLQTIENRYKEINELLLDPSVVSDVKKMTDLMKEMRSIEEVNEAYQEYKKLTSAIEDLKLMAD